MNEIPDSVTPIPMKFKFRLRNIFRRAFTTYFDDKVEEYAKVSTKHRHLSWYWEQVAKGRLPMPDEGENVQRLADNGFISMALKRIAEQTLMSPENRFRVKFEK